jgi:D-alanyl-D-alanine carboxypeptidase/D-alanyl-D-alanine-endopeptidase (penicillin-binding protein 4)
MVFAACSSSGASTETDGENGEATEFPAAALEIMESSGATAARWTLLVEPVEGGAPVYSIDEAVVSPMASVTKMYSVGTWLDVVGPDHRIETPVHAIGSVIDGTLDGDLVLRAMGDLVMGGRDADTDVVGYGVPPQEAANAVPGARPAPGDPLAGLDSLARQVAESGVTDVEGQVVIDDRLFEPWTTDRPLEISPLAINDNLLAVVTSPTADGQPAALEMIPQTGAFDVVNETQTVADGDETTLRIENRRDADGAPTNTLVVSGQIAADSEERLNVYAVDDPASFARTLFIEALERAGVNVATDPLDPNDASGLPIAANYTAQPPLGTIESPTAAALATFILKTSNNFGADLTVCLLAVHEGSTDCADGFDPIRTRLDDLDIDPGEVWLFDGSGSGSAATTPRAMLTWLQWLYGRDWGDRLPEMLPILGVDGSLALSETDTPSTGRVQAKTGTWALLDPSTFRLLIPTQGLAGFMDADDGTVYAFTLFMHGASFESLDGILDSSDTVARIAAAVQQTL